MKTKDVHDIAALILGVVFLSMIPTVIWLIWCDDFHVPLKLLITEILIYLLAYLTMNFCESMMKAQEQREREQNENFSI